jgi:hypothetical protein
MNKWDFELFKTQGGLRTIREDSPDDLFLVCASYETRSIAVMQSLSSQYRSRRGIIYVNRELRETPKSKNVEYNLSYLYETLRKHCDAVAQVEGSWRDPRKQLTALRAALAPKDSNEVGWTITLDTTTFNRESLLTALALLRTHLPQSNLRITYTSPSDYGNWLSRGFRGVRNVMSFAGIQQASRPTLLVVLSGFEPERTLKLIEEHEPNKVLLGIGDPPTKEPFLEKNVIEQKLVFARQEVELFKLPVNDILDCWMYLESLFDSYKTTHNIVVAPMSTKLSTIGVYLLAEHHPEVQISCCIPGEYNTEDYSKGIDSIFIDELPLARQIPGTFDDKARR